MKKSINNLVAKHSRNARGAGVHKSVKDYRRNEKHKRDLRREAQC